jgi:hypothetical protein
VLGFFNATGVCFGATQFRRRLGAWNYIIQNFVFWPYFYLFKILCFGLSGIILFKQFCFGLFFNPAIACLG